MIFFAQPKNLNIEILFKAVGDEITASPNSTALNSPTLYITGTYTGTDEIPTGLFIDKGNVINAQALSWDGILIVDSNGRPRLFNRRKVEIDAQEFDLSDPAQLADFVLLAKQRKLSVLQSHLLVTGGKTDVRQREDAKKFRRRALINTRSGNWLVYDSLERQITFYEEANIAFERYNAQFALNLDMGSYDYCHRISPKGGTENCGLLEKTSILTNILRLRGE